MDQSILNIEFDYSSIIHDKPKALADHEMEKLINAIKLKRKIDNERPVLEPQRKRKRKGKSPELSELEKIQKKLFAPRIDKQRKPVAKRLFTPLLDDDICIDANNQTNQMTECSKVEKPSKKRRTKKRTK